MAFCSNCGNPLPAFGQPERCPSCQTPLGVGTSRDDRRDVSDGLSYAFRSWFLLFAGPVGWLLLGERFRRYMRHEEDDSSLLRFLVFAVVALLALWLIAAIATSVFVPR